MNLQAIFHGHYESVKRCIPENQRNISRSFGETPKWLDESSQAISDVVLRDLLCFVKPFNADLPEDDSDQYYMEQEWRLNGNFRFRLEDVWRVFLPEAYAQRFHGVYAATGADAMLEKGDVDGYAVVQKCHSSPPIW